MGKITNKLLKEISYQTGQYTLPPEFLSLLVTMRCNFRCQSCSIWQKPLDKELDEQNWSEIIGKLIKTLEPNTFVEINGGEPLMRKDFTIFLIKELKKYFRKITLNSNGLLINEEILDELKQAGLDTIKISFYSLNAKTHNDLRGHESAYDHAKKAIELINKKQIALEIGLLITSKNIKEVPSLVQYLQKLPNTSIILQPLDEKVESLESKNRISTKLDQELWPTKNDTNTFFDWITHNNKNIKNSLANIEAIRKYYLNPNDILKYRCFAGQRNLVVYPNGDVALCFKGGIVGNLKEQNLEKILDNAVAERQKIKHCKKYCRIIGCNFSRGLKEYAHDKICQKTCCG